MSRRPGAANVTPASTPRSVVTRSAISGECSACGTSRTQAWIPASAARRATSCTGSAGPARTWQRGPWIRRDDQLTARVQGESGVLGGRQADHRGAAGARRGEHGGAPRHQLCGVGFGQAARPDQAGDLAHAVTDGGAGPHPQAVQPAQRGQRRRDDCGLGPRARPVLPGGRRGRLPGEQQDHAPGGAVRGEQPGTRGQLAGGQAGQQPGGFPGEPGQLVLAGRHDRDPDRAGGAWRPRLAGEVTQFAVGQPAATSRPPRPAAPPPPPGPGR